MSSPHTPGPWTVKDGHYPGFIEIQGPSFTISIVLSATDLSFDDSIRRRVDADFIAAAPETAAERDELLEAMEGIIRYGSDTLSGRADGGPDDRQWQREAVQEMTRRARAAIAKAERSA